MSDLLAVGALLGVLGLVGVMICLLGAALERWGL